MKTKDKNQDYADAAAYHLEALLKSLATERDPTLCKAEGMIDAAHSAVLRALECLDAFYREQGPPPPQRVPCKHGSVVCTICADRFA